MNHSDNIDQQEITQFELNAGEWWNPAGSFKTLHEINPLRLAFIDKSCSLLNKNVIDVGCGGGILAEAMAKLGAKVTGIDASEKALQSAQAHALQENIPLHYTYATAELMANQNPTSFDVVTCMELLEHVPDPASVIQACSQLVKANGDVFFSTINRNLRSYLLGIVAAEYVLKIIPKGLHHYEKFIRPSELSAWARAAGLELIKIQGLNYNPISRSFQLTPDVRVNYMMHCKKL